MSSNNVSAIEFKCDSFSIFVISAYLRPTIKNPDETLYALCNLLKSDTQTNIFCIDTNAKHKLWGSSQTDSKGASMESAITAKKLNILNRDPDECEFTPVGTSFIDITLAGDKIANNSWSYLDLPSLSDHPYITFDFGLSSFSTPKPKSTHRVPKLQQIMIEPLLIKLSNSLCNTNLPLTTRSQTENSIVKLSQAITENAIKCKKDIVKTVSNPPKMPWWNDELANLRLRMRQAYKKWQYNRNNAGTSTFLINAARMLFKAEAAKCQRLIRTRKKETWENFCTNDMNNDLQTSLRYLARKEYCRSNPSSLLVDGNIIKSPVDIARAFASHFFKPTLPSSDCHTSITKKNDNVLSHPSCHTPPIPMYELESAISTLKPTNSAGIDQLSSSLILATHLCYDHTLLEILNVSLSNGWFPSPGKSLKSL